MQTDILELLQLLFKDTFNEKCEEINELPISGSARKYYRLRNKKRSVIGTYNKNEKENRAFIHYSKIFKKNNINVPEIYADDLKKDIYIQEDLGDETLYDRVKSVASGKEFPDELIKLYKNAVENLSEMQFIGGKKINFDYAYPRSAFDKQSIMWDLNYFKYNFLKFTDVNFDEQLLELDFLKLTEYLLSAETDFFLFRDFKSKNIMIKDNKLFFIDYQGGRKGSLFYDPASLLFDAADIPLSVKEIIFEHYKNHLKKKVSIEEQSFNNQFYAHALIRLLQVLGAYGFRGLFEKKKHFIESIPTGLKNIQILSDRCSILNELAELRKVLNALSNSKKLSELYKMNLLRVTIKSFSYKRGIPYDNSGNGGGHVFDCRFINNPGRIDKYKDLCGKDKEVIQFMENQNETEEFFKSIKLIVSKHISVYNQRNFSHLAVNFGCTGGRHRSVFFAEKTAEYLKNTFNIHVELIHTEGF